ncbi:MAG TPA: DUF1768 domain-containing protein [Candidatus Coprenecus stercorigallinarum]|nr:DUF1768 domain-containing protein [Candidatus Coprenecus stercorigallinarum]
MGGKSYRSSFRIFVDKILVEASPYDTVWGIGMKEDDPDCRNPRLWKGENLLGFALMDVREKLSKMK